MTRAELAVAASTLWVVLAAVLVMFMQAGFALLEVGFSRGKNVAAGIAKILSNFSVATLVWWAVGFGVAFGGAGTIAGNDGFFFSFGEEIGGGLVEGPVTGASAGFMLFQFMFCAVSLAIVWGTTLERIKFGAYVVYSIVFAAVIYPLIAHWSWGGGWLGSVGGGVQDFAGSTVVHLIGATGGLAALLLLGPRRGKYGADRKPRPIPGHSMPLVGLGVLILWLGWFGFNPGSTMAADPNAIAHIFMTTNTAAFMGLLSATLMNWMWQGKPDLSMSINGVLARLVAITAPCAFVSMGGAFVIGIVAGALVVGAVLFFDRVKVDDPVGAISVHMANGVWGTLALGLFADPAVTPAAAVAKPGLFMGGGMAQLMPQIIGVGAVAAFVFTAAMAGWVLLKLTVGIRVSAEEEMEGLDVGEHGNVAYPDFHPVEGPEFAPIK